MEGQVIMGTAVQGLVEDAIVAKVGQWPWKNVSLFEDRKGHGPLLGNHVLFFKDK